HPGRQQIVDTKRLLFFDRDLMPGQRRHARVQTHISSPPATLAARRGAWSGALDGAEPSTTSPGKTFPGFIRPWGSSTWRIRSITSRSSSEKMYRMFSRFSSPIPCSPVTDPPASAHSLVVGDANLTRPTLAADLRHLLPQFLDQLWNAIDLQEEDGAGIQ